MLSYFWVFFLNFILINKYYFFRYNGHILFMETPRLWWWVLAFCALKSNTSRAIYQTSKCNIHGLIKQKCQNDFENVMTRVICSIYILQPTYSFKCSNLFPFRTNWLLFVFKVIMRRRRQINLLFVYLSFCNWLLMFDLKTVSWEIKPELVDHFSKRHEATLWFQNYLN